MKNSILLVLFLLCVLPAPTFAQSEAREFAPHAVYLELGGPGLLYSVNYEYRFFRSFSLRAGFTHFTLSNFFLTDLTITAFPIVGNFLMGGRDHFFEAGLGVMPAVGENSFRFIEASTKASLVGIAEAGYRYQPARGGFLFRVTGLGLFTRTGSGGWAGMTFGYVF